MGAWIISNNVESVHFGNNRNWIVISPSYTDSVVYIGVRSLGFFLLFSFWLVSIPIFISGSVRRMYFPPQGESTKILSSVPRLMRVFDHLVFFQGQVGQCSPVAGLLPFDGTISINTQI